MNKKRGSNIKNSMIRWMIRILISAGVIGLFGMNVLALEGHVHDNVKDTKYHGLVRHRYIDYQKINNEKNLNEIVNPGYIHYLFHSDGSHEMLFCIMPFAQVGSEYQCKYTLEEALGWTYRLDVDAAQLASSLQEITYFGYSSIPPSNRTNEDYFATQYTLWEEMGFTVSEANGNDFSWYRPMAEHIQRKKANWGLDPSFSGITHQVVPGETFSLTDDHLVIESFMYAAGYHPGTPAEVQPGVTMTWDGANTLTFTFSKDILGEINLDFTAGAPLPTPEAYWFGDQQAKMPTVEKMPPKSFQIRFNAVWPTGSLKLVKTGAKITSYTPTDVLGNTVYEPQYQEMPLAGAEFELRSAEILNSANGVIQAGETVASGTSDGNGSIFWEELPCGEYLLYETATPGEFINHEEAIPVSITENGPNGEYQEITISNPRKYYDLIFKKVFKNCGDYQEVDLLTETNFAFETLEDLVYEEGVLPKGSLVSAGYLIPQETDGIETVGTITADGEDKHWIGRIEVPRLGLYRLTELSTHSDFQLCEAISLDLSDEGKAVRQDDGRYMFDLSVVLVNEKIPEETEAPTETTQKETEEPTPPNPTETTATTPETTPEKPTEPPQTETVETTVETEPLRIEWNPPLPVQPSPLSLPVPQPPQVVAAREPMVASAVLLPRTGDSNHLFLSLATLLVSLCLMILRRKMF